MFLSKIKKSNVYPCKPQFHYIKVGFKRVKIISVCFRDVFLVETEEPWQPQNGEEDKRQRV